MIDGETITREKQIRRFIKERNEIETQMTVSVRTSARDDLAEMVEGWTYTSLMLTFADGHTPQVILDEHGKKSVRLLFDYKQDREFLIEALEYAVKSLKEMTNEQK